MTKNPLYNALLALLYIVLIVTVITVGSEWVGPDQPDNYLIPVGMISLFVLSAAVTGYIVLYQPLVMFWDGKRVEGLTLFLRTILIFGVFTFVTLIASFFIVK